MPLVLPPKELFVMPRVVECPNVQEVYADCGVVRDCGEVMRIVFAVQLRGDQLAAEQNLCVVMKRRGFAASLVHASYEFIPTVLLKAPLLSAAIGLPN